VQIDVFQDIACPFCWIGKRNMQLALAEWKGTPVTVRYRAFILDPTIPPEGADFLTHMQAKSRSGKPPEFFFDAPRRMGAEVGLQFNFDKITRAPNSLLAHRLIRLSPADKQEALVDAIYAAYFRDGQDPSDPEVLYALATQVGLDVAKLRQLIQDGEALAEVEGDIQWAQAAGIQGVPFFVFDNRVGLSGAQPPAAFIDALHQLSKTTTEA